MKLPWTARVVERTLLVSLPDEYRVLSWAPLGGGLSTARTLLNHQVRTDDTPAETPAVFLQQLAHRLGAVSPVVGLMTGVLMERLVRTAVQRHSLTLECFATVGLSNALSVGDSATYEEAPGTINLIVVLNQALTDAALVEAVAVATEAKTRALCEAQVKSTVSNALATGTGTDCVAIACPRGTPAYQYCGKHTLLGEVLGQSVYAAVVEGVRRATATSALQ